uniref:DNA-deoxyinosine glycosylase n=1 Tax=Muribaculaceae bacterium Z82 TaxID=2304548 RepID=A0A7C9NSP5_9BACT
MHVTHTIEPVFDAHSRVLLLGTIPSPKSRETGFYYGHPRNRFWPVMAALFDEPVPQTNQERAQLLLRHRIALWDVLASCDIDGASDASIAQETPNDLRPLFAAAPISHVFCTGATAARLYRIYDEPVLGIAAVQLPSTSPANAAFSFERLVTAYDVVKQCVEPDL